LRLARAMRQGDRETKEITVPKLKTKDGEIEVSVGRIARMADRMHRLGGEGRAKNYAEKARKRLEAGPARRTDAAIVIAAGISA
jgi:hypothetical protein